MKDFATPMMVKIACLYNALSEVIELEASPVEVQLLLQKHRKGEKQKAKKLILKPKN